MPRPLILLAGIAALMVAAMASARGSAPKLASLPPDVVPEQSMVLHRNVGTDADVRVTVGIPFPPGILHDPHLLRILDDKGMEVPAAVQTTLQWYAKDKSVRAVRVQFRARLDAGESTYYFAFGKPRQRDLAGWSYTDGLVDAGQGLRAPAVLATLTPTWLCESLLAGPQLPASPNEAYAGYVAAQFQWAKKLPASDPTAWLFDRPSTLFKAYIRTARFDYLPAADLS